MFQLTIVFEKKDTTRFGGISSNQCMTFIASAEKKDEILRQFKEGTGVLSIDLGGMLRHVNMRNILYIDEVEIVDENGGKDDSE